VKHLASPPSKRENFPYGISGAKALTSHPSGPYLFLLTVGLILWPLLLTTFPPILDYYSHLARVHITSNIQDFSDFYAINETLPPNVSLDVVVTAFVRLLPIETAGWLFLVCTLVIQATGLWALNSKLQYGQHVRIGPLLGCALLYNSVLTMGFLNYLFGLGLMLWMMWLWLTVRGRRWWMALTLGTVATVVLYFAHIIAFAIYAIIIAGYELQQMLLQHRYSPRERIERLVKGALPFVIPALLYITNFQGDMQLVQYSQDHFLGKLHAIVGTLSTGSSSYRFSVAGFAALATLTLALGRPCSSISMAFPIALLILLFLVAPTTFAGGRYFGYRLALPIALLACASLRVDFSARWRAVTVVAALVAFLAFRGQALSSDFVEFDADVRQSLDLFMKIERRSTVAVAIDTTHPEFSWSPRGRANWHVASLAALHAPVFVATTHAQRSQHTMVLKGSPYTDLYAWQKEMPIELLSDKHLASTVSQYRQLVKRGHDNGKPLPTPYLLLLMPYNLAPETGAEGVIIGQTKWFLLLKMRAETQWSLLPAHRALRTLDSEEL
jgi:hypothetical protein